LKKKLFYMVGKLLYEGAFCGLYCGLFCVKIEYKKKQGDGKYYEDY
jgi:hypothetical protein